MTGAYDAIVVGAGPGGSSAAFHLATRARHVLLLDREAFPRDKSCGDGVTRAAVRLIDEMGLGEQVAGFQTIGGLRVRMPMHAARDFRYPRDTGGGAVIPRLVLDELLVRQAQHAGAELWERAHVGALVWQVDEVAGVVVSRDGDQVEIRAPIVIAADGATSVLGRQAGLSSDGSGLGTAIRAYGHNIAELDDLLEIDMPLRAVGDRQLLPSYGWIFPTGDGSANIGAGLFERTPGTSVRSLLERYFGELRARDPRFADATLERFRGAPLRFDFSPDRVVRPGLALVGDAAGLISPFTGEGISFALESGKLAAEAIDRELRRGNTRALDLQTYRRALENRYSGYFEAGRHGAQRYRLVWHVLDDTFDVDRPAFRLVREAVLFPEGLGESVAGSLFDDMAPSFGDASTRVRADLVDVTEALIHALRRDWPFVTRGLILDDPNGVPIRPATVLLLAFYAAGGDLGAARHLAAALELGHLGALAHTSVVPEESPSGTNWGNTFAVVAGDYLLAKAYALTAEVGADATRTVAQAVARAAEARARELRHGWRLDVPVAERIALLRDKFCGLFEVPAALGLSIGHEMVARDKHRVRVAAEHIGVASQLVDEIGTLLGTSKRHSLEYGAAWTVSASAPVLVAAEDRATRDALVELAQSEDQLAAHDELVRIVRTSGAGLRTAAIARSYVRRARSSLNEVAERDRVAGFTALIEHVASSLDRVEADVLAGPDDI